MHERYVGESPRAQHPLANPLSWSAVCHLEQVSRAYSVMDALTYATRVACPADTITDTLNALAATHGWNPLVVAAAAAAAAAARAPAIGRVNTAAPATA